MWFSDSQRSIVKIVYMLFSNSTKKKLKKKDSTVRNIYLIQNVENIKHNESKEELPENCEWFLTVAFWSSGFEVVVENWNEPRIEKGLNLAYSRWSEAKSVLVAEELRVEDITSFELQLIVWVVFVLCRVKCCELCRMSCRVVVGFNIGPPELWIIAQKTVLWLLLGRFVSGQIGVLLL